MKTPPDALSTLLDARRIAVVGASADPTRISGRPIAYMRARGFGGMLFPVNPGRAEVQGLPAYPSLAAIGQPVDLAIIATAAAQVEGIIKEGIAAGIRAFVVFSSGFAELDDAGWALQQRLTALARTAGIAILGPNCLGVANSSTGLIASFTTALETADLRRGGFSLVSQSGALGAYWLDIVLREGLGFAQWITTGNECDIQVASCIDHLVDDPETRVIGLYLEQIRDVPAFRRALQRAAAAGKPVIAIKAGRSQAGAAAAASHTGALAGDFTLYEACLQQHGAIRVASLTAMMDVARLFLFDAVPAGPRLAVLSVSGGAGVMIADAADALGMGLATFTDATRVALRDALPAFVQPANPVDLTGNVVQDQRSIGAAMTAIAADPGVDGIVLFVGMMHGIADEFVSALARVRSQLRTPLIVIWIGALDSTVAALQAQGLPVYADVPPALEAMAAACRLRRLHRDAVATGPAGLTAPPAAGEPPGAGTMLSEWQGKARLKALGAIAVPRSRLIPSGAALPADFDLQPPWAAKLQAAALTHKSDAGGVVLRIADRPALEAALDRLTGIGRTLGLAIDGVLVEEMIPFDHELLLGLRRDPQFGPVLTIARGGVEVELDPDAVTRLLPLSAGQIAEMIGSLRSARRLQGFRGRPAADVAAVAARIATLCDRFAGQPALRELEINPLALRGADAWALDVLLMVSDPVGGDESSKVTGSPHRRTLHGC